jgi:hypothetical protein
MGLEKQAYFYPIPSEGAIAMHLLEFLGQMGDPLQALTDQQDVELVVAHKVLN